VRRRILAGDLFQANLSQRFTARVREDPVLLFLRLVEAARAPFATYVDLGRGRRILSASPERFLRLVGSLAETRPMKGTRPRGADARSDRALRAALSASVKDAAELAMIVDLSRNDLGRVCRPGTVRVGVGRRVESYPTVHQAVGVVTGRLERGRTGVDLLRAAFPPGSVTGAPKAEALRVIDRLEGEGRGPYCGALGWLDEGGDMDLSVAIRTLCLAGPRASFRVGGGVTLLSDPEQERVETVDKAAVLVRALGGTP
jgi:para-aminobenzoate synthetase component 1